ncbi:hypothetical protein INR49_010019 [Caranx melampygus]|nr:hypothetical protein INR49_010019 [Caranx melampygus]
MGSPSRELERTLSQLFTRSVVKATRFLQDQEQTRGMEGQWVLLGRFSHSHTYANSMIHHRRRGQRPQDAAPGDRQVETLEDKVRWMLLMAQHDALLSPSRGGRGPPPVSL